MTKEQMIVELEKYLGEGKINSYENINRNKLMAMDLLASLKGYKTHLCQRQHKRIAPMKKKMGGA